MNGYITDAYLIISHTCIIRASYERSLQPIKINKTVLNILIHLILELELSIINIPINKTSIKYSYSSVALSHLARLWCMV